MPRLLRVNMQTNIKKIPPALLEKETEVSEQSRQLAKRLSSYMGIEAALKLAEKNEWTSVVAALVELQKKS